MKAHPWFGMGRALMLLFVAKSCWRPNRSATVRSTAASALVPKHAAGRSLLPRPPPILDRFGRSVSSTPVLWAKPKKAGSTVDSYQTVSVNCGKCPQRLFRYKKKNGTKSNLVKCYIERISEDSAGILAAAAAASSSQKSVPEPSHPKAPQNNQRRAKKQQDANSPREPVAIQSSMVPTTLDPSYSWECPACNTQFARSSLIHGRPALKLVGGKTRMTKK